MKRSMDIFLVVILMPFWLPVFCAVALAVRLKMGSPVFFRQRRAGLHEREFVLVKFRTMLEGDAPDEERLTGFGRFLRATSLDELPELFLVLAGKMSLVGPRPLPVRYLERYSEAQHHRHDVLPGITGWAQVNGRNSVNWKLKFDMDLWYTTHRNIWLDVRILFMTIFTVLGARGIAGEGSDTMTEFKGDE